jgi:DNA repair photolyase
MIERPPDTLIVQTHTHLVVDALDRLTRLRALGCDLRVHVSIETDLDHLPGLPPHGSPIERRFAAAASIRSAGIPVVVTVSPLLPIADPDRFFARVAEVADAVVLDHFIGGDGTPGGTRTLRTRLPDAMRAVDPGSVSLDYRDHMAEIARRHLPGRVGLHIDGFASRWESGATRVNMANRRDV